jgi:hypothetical protein
MVKRIRACLRILTEICREWAERDAHAAEG